MVGGCKSLVMNKTKTVDNMKKHADGSGSISMHSTADLKHFMKQKARVFFPRRIPIIVDISSLPFDENKYWSKYFNRYYYNCGCGYGAVFLIIGILLQTYYFFVYGFDPLGAWFIAFTPISLIIITGVGKVFGIARSRFRIKKALQHLLKTVDNKVS